MGANTSQPEKLSCKMLASHVSSFGSDFQRYATDIQENGICGDFLASLSEQEFMETLDDLNVTKTEDRQYLLEKFQDSYLQTKRDATSVQSEQPQARRSSMCARLPRRSKTTGTSTATVSTEAPTIPKAMSVGSNNSDSVAYLETLAAFKLMSRLVAKESDTLMKKKEELDAEKIEKCDYYKSRRGPPSSGDVAIVLTDIQGSTNLWEADPQAMARAHALHDKIMRTMNETYHGYTIDTEGDAFFFAFHTAADALQFAIKTQEALNEAPWENEILELPWAAPDETGRRGLRVNMAVHMGPATVVPNPVTQRTQYSGPAMRFAQSLDSKANGGQILATLSTYSRVQGGEHWLKESHVAMAGVDPDKDGGEPKKILEIAPLSFDLLTQAGEDALLASSSSRLSVVKRSWAVAG